jgi:hypothetical protein
MANQGDKISVSVSSSSVIDFYIMSENEFQAWQSGTSCIVQDAYVAQAAILSYSIDWSSSRSGGYEFLFINSSHQNTASIQFDATNTSGYLTTLTQLYESEIFQPQPTTITSVYTTVFSEEFVAFVLTDYGWQILLGSIAILVLLLFARRKKSRTSAVTVGLPPQPTAAAQRLREFCPNCGLKNSEDLLFCGRCGTRLEATAGSGAPPFKRRATAPVPKDLPSTKDCPRCGNPSPRGNAFCGSCGWAFNETRVY